MDQANSRKPLNFLTDDFIFAAINLFLADAGLLSAADDEKGDFIVKVVADLVDRTNISVIKSLSEDQIPVALKITESETNYAEREAALTALIPDFPQKMRTVMDLILRQVRIGEYSKINQ